MAVRIVVRAKICEGGSDRQRKTNEPSVKSESIIKYIEQG